MDTGELLDEYDQQQQDVGQQEEQRLVEVVEQLQVETPRAGRSPASTKSGMHEWLNTLLVMVLFGYVALSLDQHNSFATEFGSKLQHDMGELRALVATENTTFQRQAAARMRAVNHKTKEELTSQLEAVEATAAARIHAAEAEVDRLRSEMSSMGKLVLVMNATLSAEGSDFSSNVLRLEEARERIKKFLHVHSDSAFQNNLSRIDAKLNQSTARLEREVVRLKAWVKRSIANQSTEDAKEFESELVKTRERVKGEVHTDLAQERVLFHDEVADDIGRLDGAMETMKHTFDHKVARTKDEMEGMVHDEESTLNSDLDDVTVAMGQQVHAAKGRIAAKMKLVEANIHGEQEKNKHKFYMTQQQFKSQQEFMVDHLAGMFALLGCVISIAHVARHLQEFSRPEVQRKILAILWMVPIYAFAAWLSLALKVSGAPGAGLGGGLATGMDVVRDCYEAYAIYMFFAMMVAIVGDGDDDKVVELLAHRSEELQIPFRLCYCSRDDDSTFEFAARVLYRCKICVMQFVFVKPVAATVSVALVNKYGNNEWYNPHLPLLWVSTVLNLSVMMAFYGLIQFYHAVGPELLWCRPWPKFLCIKGVVFMTYWQSVGLSALGQIGVLQPEYVGAIQNFLICIEMFIAAVFHFFVFPPTEWRDRAYQVIPERRATRGNLGDNLAVHDFVHDLKGLWYPKPRSRPQGEAGHDSEDEDVLREEDAADEDCVDDGQDGDQASSGSGVLDPEVSVKPEDADESGSTPEQFYDMGTQVATDMEMGEREGEES